MSSEKHQFLRPSPTPASNRTLDRLNKAGKRNNLISYKMLQEIHVLYSNPELWSSLPEQAKLELTQLRGIGFNGYYPDQTDFERIKKALDGEIASSREVLAKLELIEKFVTEQEVLWGMVKEVYPSDELMHVLQDTTAALYEMPSDNGRRIVTFGSARTQPGSPMFDAARWMNETIVTGSLREDGTSETVLSGAGPGTMEAANLGAMQGRWNILQILNQKLQLADEGEMKEQVREAIVTARSQIHSMGIRIELPFETKYNEHLQLNLTIENFAPRKEGLIATTMGRTIAHNGDEHNGNPNHPAVFAMPGGFGTEDEMWQAACLIQCGKMPKMPILPIGERMSAKIMEDLEQMQSWGAISPDDWNIFTICKDEIDAVEQFHEAHSIEMSKYTKDAIHERKPTMNA